MTFRQNADSMAEYVFTEALASDQIEGARAFVAAARAILDGEGWLTP